jgi:hypothetical protein
MNVILPEQLVKIGIFILIGFYFYYVYLETLRDKPRVHRAILPIFLFFIIFNYTLGLNYVMNVVHEQDGLFLSNELLVVLFGSSGWTTQRFYDYFQDSNQILFIFFFVYMISLIRDYHAHPSKKMVAAKKATSNEKVEEVIE